MIQHGNLKTSFRAHFRASILKNQITRIWQIYPIFSLYDVVTFCKRWDKLYALICSKT